MRNGVIIQCSFCSKDRYLFRCRFGKRKNYFCSIFCGDKFRIGKPRDKIIIEKIRISNLGQKRSEKTRIKMSKSRMGMKLTEQHKENIRNGHIGVNKGEKHYNWKGGITPFRIKSWFSKEHRNWRKSIFERDNYTCQLCYQRSKGGNRLRLEAHHIRKWSDYPNWRYEINNGITLCKNCHIRVTKNEKEYQKLFIQSVLVH